MDWLTDIEENGSKVVAYTSALSFEQFVANEPVRDLVIKKIENMGEASRYLRRLHPEFVAAVTTIPWRDLSDMRNRLSHGYFDYSPTVVWRVAIDDVPPLLADIRQVITDHMRSSGRAI